MLKEVLQGFLLLLGHSGADNVADLAFRSVSLWLPWASIANIEPIVNLEEAFGKKDLSQIDMSLPELRSRLTIYGVGGKPLHR